MMSKKTASVYLFGAGGKGRDVLCSLPADINVIGFVDNSPDKIGSCYCGCPVFSPRKLLDGGFEYVLIASMYASDILEQLGEMGIPAEKIVEYADGFRSGSSAAGKRCIAIRRNLRVGQTAFLVGSGPSVRYEDLEKLKGVCTFACNRFHLCYEKTSFRPTYVGSTDLQMIKDFGQEIVEKNDGTGVYFVSPEDPKFKGEYDWLPMQSSTPIRFSTDIEKYVMPGAGTLITALQVGYYMGIRKFVLYGVDHNFRYTEDSDAKDRWFSARGDGNHFIPNYRSGKPWAPPVPWQFEGALLSSQAFLQSRGGWIKNATRGGALEVVPRIDFDDALQMLIDDNK